MKKVSNEPCIEEVKDGCTWREKKQASFTSCNKNSQVLNQPTVFNPTDVDVHRHPLVSIISERSASQ